MSTAQVTDTQQKRIIWMDYAKAIGLFLMTYAHSTYIDVGVKQWIFAFHMPLFFLLAGMLWRPRTPIDTLRKTWKSLLLPYLLINVLCLLFYFIVVSAKAHELAFDDLVNRALVSFIGLGRYIGDLRPACPPTWFIIAMFYIMILASFGAKRIGWWLVAISVVGVVAAAILVSYEVELYTPVTSALLAFPFFAVGYFSKFILKSKPNFWLLLAIAVVSFALLTMLDKINGRIDINSANWGNSMVLFYLTGIVGTVMIISVSKMIPSLGWLHRHARLVAEGALVIVGFNIIVVNDLGGRICEMLSLKGDAWSVQGSLVAIAAFVSLLFLIKVFRRFMPAILGR